jgi:hypothetical protein
VAAGRQRGDLSVLLPVLVRRSLPLCALRSEDRTAASKLTVVEDLLLEFLALFAHGLIEDQAGADALSHR